MMTAFLVTGLIVGVLVETIWRPIGRLLRYVKKGQ